jgi:hypothetical protein
MIHILIQLKLSETFPVLFEPYNIEELKNGRKQLDLRNFCSEISQDCDVTHLMCV